MISDIIKGEIKSSNKIIARALQRYAGMTKLSEAYECLAKRGGYKDWNTASADDFDLRDIVDISKGFLQFKN